MRAVITVIGKDTVGILAKVAAVCAEHSVNILEVTQSVLQELFTMIMLVDISDIDIPFGDFSDEMKQYGQEIGMVIRAMHEDIFNSMHSI